MAHQGKNKGSGSAGESRNAEWFERRKASNKRRRKLQKQSRRRNN
jgi:hypothetical protein